MKLIPLGLMLLFSGAAYAAGEDIPRNELEFLGAITKFSQQEILERLGQPFEMQEVKDPQGVVHATIWRYKNLNTTSDGQYYQYTDLDFVGGKVKDVMFSNIAPELAKIERDTPREICPSEGC